MKPMKSFKNTRQAAQNQHYVPKFVLRNFLSNQEKEQVSVFAKSNGKGFTTSIKNIMSERRFHDFNINEEYLASFEESICRLEDQVFPTYQKILEARQLDFSEEERSNLALLIAFQFLRTRAQRDQILRMEKQLADKVEIMGGKMEQIEGYEPLTEDRLKRQHLGFVQGSVLKFTEIILQKDFLLMSAPKGRSFYLADNPVCLHNSRPKQGFMGNIGLGVLGIEIYLPLSADLMLCAWCPSILHDIRERGAESKRLLSGLVLSPTLSESLRGADGKADLEVAMKLGQAVKDRVQRFEDGTPLLLDSENMTFNNSLQLSYAREHIICKQGDFALAKRFMKDFPDHKGNPITVG